MYEHTLTQAHSNTEIRIKAAAKYPSLCFIYQFSTRQKSKGNLRGFVQVHNQARQSPPEVYLPGAQGHASEPEGRNSSLWNGQ